MGVPLDQQFRIEKKGIIEERVPILVNFIKISFLIIDTLFPIQHPSSIQQRCFVTYVPVPTDINDGAAIEQWIERMTFLKEDLTWLLEQTHAKFWCEVRINLKNNIFYIIYKYFQAAFNKDFHSMFDSYLRYAPRLIFVSKFIYF